MANRNLYPRNTDDRNQLIDQLEERYEGSIQHPQTPANPNVPITNRLPEFRRTRIHSRNDLKEGDHVAWHRMWGYWHHAIFSEIDASNSNHMFVYQQSWNKKDGEANFHKESIVFRSRTDVVYRITYLEEADTSVSMARAKWLTGEADPLLPEVDKTYDVLDNNCEHSARWCKTGVHVSTQVQDLTGPTGCVTLSVKSVLLLVMRLCGLLVLFSIEAFWEHEPEIVPETTTTANNEEATPSFYTHGTREIILAVVYTIFNGFAFMVYQLYVKCKEIKEVDEPDNPQLNVCYLCCVRCYRYTYGKECTARGEKCFDRRPCKGSDSCSQCCWWCCRCCCKAPCINAKAYSKNVLDSDSERQSSPDRRLRGPHGCCVIKTRLCCKLYAGDVIMIMIREIICVGAPLTIMMLVHVYFDDRYDDLQKAGIGLAISLGCILPVYFLVYVCTQLCRSCLVCSIRCCLKCCSRRFPSPNRYAQVPNDNNAQAQA